MSLLPWECVILGVPASLQGSSSRRRAWKADVSAAARKVWPAAVAPLTSSLSVTITFFHQGSPLDVDNMLKPIQDALCGIAFVDDAQVTDVHGSLRDVNGAFKVCGLSAALAEGFVSGGPFVHIKLEESPGHEELP
ncbi:RusA family crossover junction endodeoxyribonuclease [Streptomyces sp. NPDC012616]|uniref:RusA family crossover junction endodeoxyribonuclease n=1 Tax=Streptomyces sp. NPDC012616 TaxID=3364840 RepID=UPI0036DFCD97